MSGTPVLSGAGRMNRSARRKGRTAGRLAVVDTLPGFALLGIFMVNITYLASAYHGTGVEDPDFDGSRSTVIRRLVTMLFEAKFFLLFSFLFGYSFTLQTASAERTGARITRRFLTRPAGLLALGVVHCSGPASPRWRVARFTPTPA